MRLLLLCLCVLDLGSALAKTKDPPDQDWTLGLTPSVGVKDQVIALSCKAKTIHIGETELSRAHNFRNNNFKPKDQAPRMIYISIARRQVAYLGPGWPHPLVFAAAVDMDSVSWNEPLQDLSDAKIPGLAYMQGEVPRATYNIQRHEVVRVSHYNYYTFEETMTCDMQ